MSEHCYVCSKSLDSKDTLDSASNMFRVTCPRCGTYDVSHKFIASRKHGAKFNATEWLTMSHAIRRATDAHGRFGEPILEHDMVQALVARYPLPDAVEQADIMIDSIARRSA